MLLLFLAVLLLLLLPTPRLLLLYTDHIRLQNQEPKAPGYVDVRSCWFRTTSTRPAVCIAYLTTAGAEVAPHYHQSLFMTTRSVTCNADMWAGKTRAAQTRAMRKQSWQQVRRCCLLCNTPQTDGIPAYKQCLVQQYQAAWVPGSIHVGCVDECTPGR